MSTYDELTHHAVVASLSTLLDSAPANPYHTDALRLYKHTIQTLVDAWTARGVRKPPQILFIARCCAYVSVFRFLVLPHGNKKNVAERPQFENLPASFPVMGPRFLPENPTTLSIFNASADDYYRKPVTIVDLELYEYRHFHRAMMCPRCPTNSKVEYHNIRPSNEPRRCYTINDVEDLIGIHYKCNTCKETFFTTTMKYNEKYIWWKRPGK
jgi:hypothetical protein